MISDDDAPIFLLVPYGDGYYHPRYPDPPRLGPQEPEQPGVSIVERAWLARGGEA